MNTTARSFLISLLLVYSLSASAQVLSLSGVVTDARSHAPIGQAEVTTVGGSANFDVTDSEGKFVLKLTATVKPGDIVELRVRKSGYTTYDKKVPVGGLALTIDLQPVHPRRVEHSGPPKGSQDEPPCVNSLRFEQQESVNYIGGASFLQRVTVFPRRFEGEVLPVVIFVGTEVITGGSAQGVMVNANTGDPLAAGIAVSAGRLGVVTRNSNSAELYLQDVKKFSEAKAVIVNLFSAKRFKIVCVQQPPAEQESIILPNASSKPTPPNKQDRPSGSLDPPIAPSVSQKQTEATPPGIIPPGIIPEDPERAVQAVDSMRNSILEVLGKKDTVTFLMSWPDDDSKYLAFVSNLFSRACRTDPRQCWFTQPGNSMDLDRPPVPNSGRRGITIHGRDAQALAIALSAWFTTYSTSTFPPELNGYKEAATKEIMWIEIGPGSPWKPTTK